MTPVPKKTKTQRVRTGCLTCRQRHLKCDEAKPDCLKCRKSGLACERGIRIDFLSTKLYRPEVTLLVSGAVEFIDQSKEIAKAYEGGEESYERAALGQLDLPSQPEVDMARSSRPKPDNVKPGYLINHGMLSPTSSLRLTPPLEEITTVETTPAEREYFSRPEELQYMQAFIEAIGNWMDAFDSEGHFSQLIPHMAVKAPALRSALLAFGAKQVRGQAEMYYDTAKTQLYIGRGDELCAAAAVLNMYENNRTSMATNLIQGGWNASSTGIGKACFWLHVVVEVLNCLTVDVKTLWDPDDWGVNMAFTSKQDGTLGNGRDEIWVHRIFYILASVSNFRAEWTTFEDEVLKLGIRLPRWQTLKRLCDSWNNATPRTMHPLGYLDASQTGSLFPRIW